MELSYICLGLIWMSLFFNLGDLGVLYVKIKWYQMFNIPFVPCTCVCIASGRVVGLVHARVWEECGAQSSGWAGEWGLHQEVHGCCFEWSASVHASYVTVPWWSLSSRIGVKWVWMTGVFPRTFWLEHHAGMSQTSLYIRIRCELLCFAKATLKKEINSFDLGI